MNQLQFEIPTKNTKLFLQVNKGENFGNLWSTFNMDFDTVLGKVRVASRLRIGTDSTDDADLGLPTAFLRVTTGTDRYWALCETRLFRTLSTDPTATYTEATTDDTGSTEPPVTMTAVSSDMVNFNGKFYVSLPTNIAELSNITWDNTWWTGIGGTALTTAIPHPVCVSVKSNYYMVGDGNLLHMTNTSETVSNSRVILPTEFEITWIRSNYDGAWIGARNKVGREGKIFYWDESAENYNRGYGIKSDTIFSGVVKDEIVYAVNGNGQLLKFSGSGFEEVAVFPVFGLMNKGLTAGDIHRNGMAVIGGKIHISVNSLVSNSIVYLLENFPSGIWTFDETQGLRHKYAFTQYDGTEIDYGAFTISSVGALVETNSIQGTFLAGAIIYTNASSSINAISFVDVNDSINKRGHFITSMFESSAFEDIFKDILLSFKRFLNSGDRIIIKYRTIKNANYPIGFSGTWTSTSVMTTSGSATPGSFTNITAGNEIMVVRGKGAGAVAKILSVSETGGTYTITLNEAIPGVAGSNWCFVYNWVEAATISTQGIERQSFDLDVPGTWIQLKVELRSAPAGTADAGNSPELEKIVVNTQGESVI